VEGLGGSHVNSIGQRCNDKTGTVSKVLVTVSEDGVSNLKIEVIFSIREVDFKLGLPLELLSTEDMLKVEFLNNIARVSVHGNHATNLLAHRLGEVTLDHSDQVGEELDLVDVSLLHGFLVFGDVVEGLLDVFGPRQHVNEEGGLGGVLLQPFGFADLVQSLEGGSGNVTEGAAHSVDNFLHVVFDFAEQLQVSGELNVLNTDIGVHTNSNGAITTFFKLEILNSLENLAHEAHDLLGGRTVRQNIEQVRGGGEVEAGEALLLLVHEFVKGLLANSKLGHHVLEALKYPVLVAESNGELFLDGVLEDTLDFLINKDELLSLLG